MALPLRSETVSRITQRYDIQGLRALAVSLVVVFHLSPSALPGGYIGVDVFFVISGFLITGHLFREVERRGRIGLTEFWAKRARRLLPASLLVLGVSVVAVIVFFPGYLWKTNLVDIGFATLYLVNWNLASNSVNYLAHGEAPSIAQHFWSLSVEEQFYIVWPLLIVAAVWIGSRISKVPLRRIILVVLTLVLVASLSFSIFETARSQPTAYFVTTTRAWEFAVGGITAMLPARALKLSFGPLFSWCALLVVLASAALFDAATAFPGWVAAIPVVATAALLWVGDSNSFLGPQRYSRWRPFQFLGDISYSVYLWHWPLIAVVSTLQGRAPGILTMTCLAAASIVLGWLTKRYVEDPVRRPGPFLGSRFATYSLAAAGMSFVLIIAAIPAAVQQHRVEADFQAKESVIADTEGCFGAHAILNDCANPYASSAAIDPSVARMENIDAAFDASHCVRVTVDEGDEKSCEYSGAGKSVLLIGDSHADQIVAPLAELAQLSGWNLQVETRQGCTLGFAGGGEGEPSLRRCKEWGDALIEKAGRDDSYDLVIMAVRSVVQPSDLAGPAADAMADVLASGKEVVVFPTSPGTPNTLPPDALAPGGPACLENAKGQDDPCSWVPPAYEDWMEVAATQSGATVIDVRDVLCDESGRCHSLIGGVVVYADNNHFSLTFARTLRTWFDHELTPMLEPS